MELNQEQFEALEILINKTSLAEVLEAIGDICGEKANHIRENWQDEPMAKAWEKAGRVLYGSLRLREAVSRL